jgi:hypothetical protein
MTRDIEKVIASLKFLGFKPKMKEYDTRFFIQKMAFLAQALGLSTNYCFTMYVAGPYCSKLANDCYGDVNAVESLHTSYTLTSGDKNILQKISSTLLTDMGRGLEVNRHSLECVSAAVFLMQQNPRASEDSIFAWIKKLKPHLSDYEIVVGTNKAKMLLARPEDVTEEIKREMREWDSAD